MSKKISKAKLRLSRETLHGLQPTDLDAVNGGVAYTGCDSACTQCGGKGTRFTQPRPQPNPLDGMDTVLGGRRTGMQR